MTEKKVNLKTETLALHGGQVADPTTGRSMRQIFLR